MSSVVFPSPAFPAALSRRLVRLLRRLCGRPTDLAITLACLLALAWMVPPLFRWAITDAVWSGDAAACRAASGACWAFIGAKLRFMVFGFYPPEGDPRALAATLLTVALVAASGFPRLWSRWLVAAWGAVPLAVIALMMGGFGGTAVSTEKWSGIPLTLMLTTIGLVGAFPLAVALAFGRRSNQGIVRLLSIGVIEVVRGVPMIAVLYVATLLLPLMLPSGDAIDKLVRTQAAIIVFTAAYMAEIIRAGLQSVPRGQFEAARALGLTPWNAARLVVLPQALRATIPAFANLAIGVFHDTTLVVVIGWYDLLATARAATLDPEWIGFYDEAFLFAGAVYLVVSFALSRHSQWIERRLAVGRR
jgi:general L-amino acid transport system permease protein